MSSCKTLRVLVSLSTFSLYSSRNYFLAIPFLRHALFTLLTFSFGTLLFFSLLSLLLSYSFSFTLKFFFIFYGYLTEHFLSYSDLSSCYFLLSFTLPTAHTLACFLFCFPSLPLSPLLLPFLFSSLLLLFRFGNFHTSCNFHFFHLTFVLSYIVFPAHTLIFFSSFLPLYPHFHVFSPPYLFLLHSTYPRLIFSRFYLPFSPFPFLSHFQFFSSHKWD